MCTIVINDDQVFENIESFNVELSMPVYALLGSVTRAKVNINDTEDEPTLQFDKKTYHVNESKGFIFAPIERKGQWDQFLQKKIFRYAYVTNRIPDNNAQECNCIFKIGHKNVII